MRTITATAATNEQAQTARRRLEAMGIPPDRILLKSLAETEGGAGAAQGGGGVFISAKVTPEQVGEATEILRASETLAAAEAPDVSTGPGSGRVHVSDPVRAAAPSSQAARPVITEIGPRAHGGEPGGAAADERGTVTRRTSPMRLVVIFSLIVAVGMILGALAGTLA